MKTKKTKIKNLLSTPSIKLSNYLSISLLSLLPALSFAYQPAEPQKFSDLVCIVTLLALDFVPYIIVIAFGAFLMGLVGYVKNGDNEEKRSSGRMLMIYGIVGLFFMISFWGILKIFVGSFNVPFGIPQFKDGGGTPSCNKVAGGGNR